MMKGLALFACAFVAAACGGASPPPPAALPATSARNVVLVTIDTLRADRVGAYGLASARTPVMDRLSREGVRFVHAFATAPITLTSHASLLTGRYPAGHGARHNGMAMAAGPPTMATTLKAAGLATGAFVSAFPLDRRFGLARGFDDYDDQLGRDAAGRPRNERPGAETVSRAVAWLDTHRAQRFFLWLHLFEPHAPYGGNVGSRQSGVGSPDPPGGAPSPLPALARYDEEIATADRLTGQLLAALGDAASSTLVIVAGDHGEAFGEHGEIGHSVFVYDTTLRVPLIVHGPGVSARAVETPVSLADVAPTVMTLAGAGAFDTDGVTLIPLIEGKAPAERTLYAESYAPLFDFGWSPLRSVREGQWKFILAPTPELFDVGADAEERMNVAAGDAPRVSRMRARVEAIGGPDPTTATPQTDPEARRRLQALGYVSGGAASRSTTRPDPKDRIEIASRLASVMAGEVRGDALVATLEAVLRADPGNPQAHLRLGYAHLDANRCDRALPHLRAALAAGIPSADAGLGLAGCLLGAGDLTGAAAALQQADTLEPGNPVVQANLGLLALRQDDATAAVASLTSALSIDPTLLEARFGLARGLARLGRRDEAVREARRLLDQLPPTAPQRAEVQRLIDALK